jgi:hypothetical protein
MKRAEQAPTSLSAKWDRSRQLIRKGVRAGPGFPNLNEALDLEIDVLRGPIQSLDDALAKLRAIELAFIEGERTDGADATALHETIQWLQTHKRAIAA